MLTVLTQMRQTADCDPQSHPDVREGRAGSKDHQDACNSGKYRLHRQQRQRPWTPGQDNLRRDVSKETED
jgi:hypothetical protein